MADEVVIDAFGARWRLDLDELDPASAARLTALWSRARTSRRDEVATFVVTRDPSRPVDGASARVPQDPVALPYAVSRALTLASIARRAGHDLMFHAAGLATDEGVAVALVAGSGAGKTTAALVLGRHLGYLSDETVAVGPDGTVAAYAKPLSVVDDPALPFAKTEHGPDDLGLRVAPDRPRLGAVVLLDRDPGAGSPELARAGLLDALLEVVPHTSSLALLDRPLQRLAAALTLGGGPWRLRYAEIADCRGLLEGLLAPKARYDEASSTLVAGTDVGPPAAWVGVDPPPGPTVRESEPPTLTDSSRLVRAPWRDAVSTDDEVVVLADTVPLRLSGIGATLWLAAASPVPLHRLVAVVRSRHGEHPDARRLVAEAAAALVEGGALLAVGGP